MVTIVRPAGVDAYADAVATVPTRIELPGAFTAPRSSSDVTDRGRQGVIVGLTLYAPYGTDLRHTDQVDVQGVLYDLDGDPGVWESPLSGWKAGIEVALRRANG